MQSQAAFDVIFNASNTLISVNKTKYLEMHFLQEWFGIDDLLVFASVSQGRSVIVVVKLEIPTSASNRV